MNNKTLLVIMLGTLILGVYIQIKQLAVVNSGLSIIAANQVKSEANQAIGNTTLSMIQAAIQQAADDARKARP